MSTCSQSLNMSQCVPSWEIEENPSIRIPFHPSSLINNPSKSPDVIDPTRDYEVAELTWENGQLALHGLGPPRTLNTKSNPSGRYTTTTWEKPRASGTLESIVNQAAQLAPCEAPPVLQGPADNDELVTWFNHQPAGAMDALVPSSSNNIHFSTPDPNHGKSTCVESSCGGSASIVKGKHSDRGGATVRKRRHVPRDNRSHRNNRSMTVSVSETFGRDSSRHVGGDSCEIGLTSTSLASDTNANTLDDYDSMSQSRPPKPARTKEEKSCQNEKSTISTKRSRAAAIHNQSERKRRDKINQRMKTLQKLVPNSSKTDKASMLDEVIEYLKTLQAQVQVMGRMSMPHMMMPMPMQQQLQMAMMAQMGMGMGMGMGVMDINSMARPNISGMPPVLNPAAFMPMTSSWETPNDRLASSNPVLLDPMASFLASQSQQPMTIDAYSRMAAMYQQLHQQHGSNSKP